MTSINNYIIVVVVNALTDDKKSTNYFDRSPNMLNAAMKSIQESMGNQHANTNIQKQAYSYDMVKTVRAAFGITGTNFNTHDPYINGQKMSLDSILSKNSEVTLIKKGLNIKQAFEVAGAHKIIPERTNVTLPKQLGDVQPPDERAANIVYEVLGTNESPGPLFGPGNAGQPGAYGDFGGQGINELG